VKAAPTAPDPGRRANPGAGDLTDSAQVVAQPSTGLAPLTASESPEEAPTNPTGPEPITTEPCDPNQPAGYATSAAVSAASNRVED
jgi:hypothetical protein